MRFAIPIVVFLLLGRGGGSDDPLVALAELLNESPFFVDHGDAPGPGHLGPGQRTAPRPPAAGALQ